MNSQTSPKLRFFNTATKTKQDFVPLDANNVRMYVCGPTVYDYAHIGNARPAIVFDVLFRLLRHVYGKEHVTYVRNITDVDDKINARAARDFPDLALNEAIGRLTKKTEIQYQNDMAALGCLEPSLQPRATSHIAQMIEMIEILLKKGNAYVADGHVLFDVKSFRRGDELLYGRLSRRSLNDMIAGARVEIAPYKRDAMDFVMWKPSADNEPGWDSPWGLGRPGWHIECSAMSRKYLGEIFDIHGGGIDLSFPHHENELAQSCCATGKDKMAQIWMHNGFLQVEGEKMSKSLGNFITVNELLNTTRFGGRKWPGEVLRLAMLMTHYRQPIDFSVARLEEAEVNLGDWLGLLEEYVFQRNERNLEAAFAASIGKTPEIDLFLQVLCDDLNTPNVIARFRGMVPDIKHTKDKNRRRELALDFLGMLSLLGILTVDSVTAWRSSRTIGHDAEHNVQGIISRRLKAISEKNWPEADKIRAELAAQGIQLMDYKDPETGERRTKWEVKQ